MPERNPTPVRVIVRRKTDARDAAMAKQKVPCEAKKGAANKLLPFISKARREAFRDINARATRLSFG